MVIVNGWSPIRASFADAALLAAVNVFLRKLEQWHRDRNPQHHSESKDKLRRLLMQRVPTEFVPTELVQAELPAIPDKYCSTTLDHWGTLTQALHMLHKVLMPYDEQRVQECASAVKAAWPSCKCCQEDLAPLLHAIEELPSKSVLIIFMGRKGFFH